MNALRSQLNWTQYRLLIQIEDLQEREYYELESVNHCWTARETEHKTILAAEYKLRLPSEAQLLAEVRKVEAEYSAAHE